MSQRDLVVRALRGSGSVWEVVSETLDIPTPSLLGLLGSNPFGLDIGKLVHLRDSLVPESVMSLTLLDLVGGAISDDEAVRARYLGWIAKAKAELMSLSGNAQSERAVKDASAIRKELSASKNKIKRSAALSAELKAVGKKLNGHAKLATSIRMKINKGKPGAIKADATPVCEILSELLGRLGITDHVAYISAVVRHAEDTRAAVSTNRSATSLGSIAAHATSGPSLISLLSKGMHLVKTSMNGGAMLGGKSNDRCTTVMGVIVCDSAAEGEGIPEGPSFGRRYVIQADSMTLERGPGFRVDAFEVLDKSLEMFEVATTNLRKDKDRARAYVMTLLDALAEAFKMPASHGNHKRGSAKVKITTTTGGCALCAEEHVSRLDKLGMIQKGGKDRIMYVQNVQTAEQQQMSRQHLRNDTYFSTCFGCLVAIEACQCCMEFGEYMSDE